jgi:hypothetical protein
MCGGAEPKVSRQALNSTIRALHLFAINRMFIWAGPRDVRFRSERVRQDERSRQMRYRPTIDSDFSVVVVLHREGRIDGSNTAGQS